MKSLNLSDYKFKSVFASQIIQVHNKELEQSLATNSLEKLAPLIPEKVDLNTNLDLIGIVLNGCVAGLMNSNKDAIDLETGIKIAENFIWKLVDIEHNRNKIVGVICNSGFSSFGSNKLLTLNEAKQSKDPINISIAALLYKLVLSETFVELLEKSSDPNSDKFNSISGSWEILFNAYDIAIGSKTVSEAKLITNEEDKKKYEEYLTCNGGDGTYEGSNIYRVIKDDFIVPAGIGLVERPAANVKGIYVVEKNTEDQNQSNSSQINKLNVTNSEENKVDTMKITNIKDITDESLKQINATAISEFIQSEIVKISQEYDNKVNERDNKIKANEELIKQLTEKSSASDVQIKTISEQLNKLQSDNLAREEQELFNQRMSLLEDTFELSDADKSVVASQVRGLNKEQFDALLVNYQVIMKEKNKVYKAEQAKAKLIVANEPPVVPVVVAPVAPVEPVKPQEVVQAAVSNATATTAPIPNAATMTSPTVREKYSKYFAVDDGFSIKL